MAYSSLLGTKQAAREPAGRDIATLGPGDSSDSGSDMMGLADSDDSDPNLPVDLALSDRQTHPLEQSDTLDTTGDAAGSGERRSAGSDAGRPDGSDIGVDRIFTPGASDDDDVGEFPADDEDGDLAFLNQAEAGDPLDEEFEQEASAPPVPGQQPNPQPDPPPTPSGDEENDLPDDEHPDEHKPGRTSARRA